MKMQGYSGSQLWDTTFAIQAIISTNLIEEYGPTLRKAHSFIKNSQVLDNSPGDLDSWYRHITKGGLPFSTGDHGWTVSDCTAEGLNVLSLYMIKILTCVFSCNHFSFFSQAALLSSKLPSEVVGEPLDTKRLYDAVNVILSLHNIDGGYATYELTRSYQWLELLKHAEMFGDIVIDYT